MWGDRCAKLMEVSFHSIYLCQITTMYTLNSFPFVNYSSIKLFLKGGSFDSSVPAVSAAFLPGHWSSVLLEPNPGPCPCSHWTVSVDLTSQLYTHGFNSLLTESYVSTPDVSERQTHLSACLVEVPTWMALTPVQKKLTIFFSSREPVSFPHSQSQWLPLVSD